MRRAGKRAGATAGRAMDAVRDALARSPSMVAFISLLTAAAAASVAPSRPAVGSGPLTLEPSPRLGVRQISERSDLSLLRLRGGEQQSTYAMLKPDIAGDAATVEAVKEMIAAAGLTLEREEACQLCAPSPDTHTHTHKRTHTHTHTHTPRTRRGGVPALRTIAPAGIAPALLRDR